MQCHFNILHHLYPVHSTPSISLTELAIIAFETKTVIRGYWGIFAGVTEFSEHPIVTQLINNIEVSGQSTEIRC